MGHLRLRVHFSRDPSHGGVSRQETLIVSVGRGVFGQVDFHSLGRGSFGLEWSSYQLLSGARTSIATSNEVVIEFSNYLQTQSVRPGEASLNLYSSRVDGDLSLIESVEVLPGSSVVQTTVAPPSLEIDVDAPTSVPESGEMKIAFALSPRGIAPARDVRVVLADLAGAGVIVSPGEIVFPQISSTVKGTFSVTVSPDEALTLLLDARGQPGNAPVVRLDVEPSRGREFHGSAELATVSLITALVVLAAIARIRAATRSGRP